MLRTIATLLPVIRSIRTILPCAGPLRLEAIALPLPWHTARARLFALVNRSMIPILAVGCGVVVLLAWGLRSVASRAADADTPASSPDRLEAVVSDPDPAVARPASGAAPASTFDERLRVARALVVDQLRGSADVRFRSERVLQDGQIVCMEVAVGGSDGTATAFTKAVVITRPDRTPSVWVDRGHEVVAHIACELA